MLLWFNSVYSNVKLLVVCDARNQITPMLNILDVK